MRIIAGTYRGKKLLSPDGLTTRPTSDRARESLFNILTSYLLKNNHSWGDVSFADVFAGTGAIGLEALSRGAHFVTFIENNPTTLKCLQKNCEKFPQTHILSCDALTPPIHEPVSILFMDAPYGQGLWQKALQALTCQGWINDKTLIIIETDAHLTEELPPAYHLIQNRSAGRNVFLFALLQKES